MPVVGTKEIDRALNQLSKANSKTVLNRSLRESAKPFLKTARSLARVKTGELKKSIAIRNKQRDSRRRRDVAELFVGPSWPRGAHGHLIEFGHGKVRAYPFLRPAWNATKREVRASVELIIWRNLEKQARKLAQKARAGKLSRSEQRALSR